MPLPNRLLAARPLVALGAMAYSLYLWHWPLLIFWLSYTGHRHANFVDGAAVLLVSGVLAYLTTRLVEDPLRYPQPPAPQSRRTVPTIPWRSRLRRPTMALGSVVVLLGVTLTATSFTWRQHVTVLRAAGKELSVLNPQDYPGARALTEHVRVPDAADAAHACWRSRRTCRPRPGTAASVTSSTRRWSTASTATSTATRTIALAGGSHAEHWLPALDLLGQLHHFKVVTYLKMGCPLSTEQVPLIMGNNAPYPQCREWVQRTMAKLVADRPDYVFTTTTRPWNIKSGDVMPATYIGIWQTLSDNNIPILGMRDTPWLVKNGKPFDPADCLAKKGGNAQSCAVKRSDVLSDRNQTLDFVTQFPLLKVLDMSDAICRADVCRPVEGNVLIYHGAHHLSPDLRADHGQRAGPPDRGRHRLVVTRPPPTRARIRSDDADRPTSLGNGPEAGSHGQAAHDADRAAPRLPTVWPGTPIHSGPPMTARAPTFRCSPRSPRRSSCA